MRRALLSYRSLVSLSRKSTSEYLLYNPRSHIETNTLFFNEINFLNERRFSYAAKLKCETSTIPIIQNQDVEILPHLPVPQLNNTLSKYLRSVKPLLTESEFEKTLSVVKSFGADNGIGPKLQRLLEARAKTCDNWLSDWWLRSAYLEYRSPVLIFSSPGFVFPIQNFSSPEDQYRCAAKLIYGALQFKNSLDTKTIKLDRTGKNPLDMSQYNNVFGTNRTPRKSCDELKYHPNSQHFVIAYKNYFFKVPAYSNDHKILEPNEILKQIKYLVGKTSGLSGIPVGLLTSEHRDTWSNVYQFFGKDKVNASSLKVLEEALFLVSIDRTNRPLKNPKGTTTITDVEDLSLSEKQTISALQMLHGNRTNSGNRWNDKTIQFIIGSDGEWGITYEHSPADGTPVANLMDFCVNNMSTSDSLLTDFSQGPLAYTPTRLEFNIDQQAVDAIAIANDNLGKLIDDLDMACFTFKKYGVSFIKSCSFSPDSFIQMAIQSAFHRVHGIPGAHYESASTRIYLNGRTETIRSCSSEALKFSDSLNSSAISSRVKYETMKEAIEGHKNYATEAVRGYGVDRHLLGLKLIAKDNRMEIPELFTDLGYTKSTHFRLSTSQISSVNQAFVCYGPVVPNGYGCCYNPRSHDISFGLSVFNSSKETNAEQFKISLQEVLLEMQKVAAQNSPSKL